MSRHLLGIRHLDREDIEELLGLSKDFKKKVLEGRPIANGKAPVVGLLFFEGSTRTRVSFEQAATYLGYRVSNFASGASSMSKGETLKDTILTLRYERLEALVMRHRSSGSASFAARYFGGPVLNAGDGQHEHPTQALGDALTILERKGSLEGLTVAIVGDVAHSRVARSNAWLLSKMGADVRFVGPRTLIPGNVSMLPGTVYYDLAAGVDGADVVICLRLQRERMEDGQLSSVNEYRRLYQINRHTLRYANPGCLVMHPGPLNRGVEVDDMAADGDASAISQQIENGIFVRMAALYWAFQDPPAKPAKASAKAAVQTGKARRKKS
ncbi:MAG TPA: aspartate carbamoyltransferase catalytic subunit [Fimbriimonadaceae bacterium]|nr:aspartate carbamoyltransferase catalytic subunit [Fimbriimonadaceae bacterium]HRJ95545.1 aspartate carbamoyltransferase catalytic subunit [Fimbriimonadaceae bacterium]